MDSMWQVSYAAVGGPGVIMRILCFACSILSFCSSLAAVGFIWVRIPSNHHLLDEPPLSYTLRGGYFGLVQLRQDALARLYRECAG